MSLKKLALILSSFSFFACSTVPIHDDPWCADAGARGAYCTTTLSGQRFYLNKYQWDKLRAGQMCTATTRPGEGYKNIKVPLEQLCANSNLCTPGQRAQLQSISQELDTVLGDSSGSPAFSGGDPAKSAPTPTLESLDLRQ